jgi:hypothetical protein
MSLTKNLVIGLGVLALGFGVVGTVTLSRRSQEPRLQITKKNKTSALELERVEILPQGVKAILKNKSAKTIDGIQLLVNGGHVQIDFLGAAEESYQRVLPGGVYELFLSRHVIAQPLEIAVLAVTFNDHSSDGDLDLAQEILDTRRGFNRQVKRVRPLMEAALNSPDADAISILDKLKSSVERLQIEEGTHSRAMREGQSEARAEMLNEIQFLRQRQVATGSLPIRRALAKMKDRHEKRIKYGPE